MCCFYLHDKSVRWTLTLISSISNLCLEKLATSLSVTDWGMCSDVRLLYSTSHSLVHSTAPTTSKSLLCPLLPLSAHASARVSARSILGGDAPVSPLNVRPSHLWPGIWNEFFCPGSYGCLVRISYCRYIVHLLTSCQTLSFECLEINTNKPPINFSWSLDWS